MLVVNGYLQRISNSNDQVRCRFRVALTEAFLVQNCWYKFVGMLNVTNALSQGNYKVNYESYSVKPKGRDHTHGAGGGQIKLSM